MVIMMMMLMVVVVMEMLIMIVTDGGDVGDVGEGGGNEDGDGYNDGDNLNHFVSSFVAQTGSITHRPIHKVSSTNNDLIPHGATDIPESVRSLDRIGTVIIHVH